LPCSGNTLTVKAKVVCFLPAQSRGTNRQISLSIHLLAKQEIVSKRRRVYAIPTITAAQSQDGQAVKE